MIKTVEDEQGRKKRLLLADGVTDPEQGIYIGVPDLDALDWESLITALHNNLHDANLFELKDVEQNQSGISGAVVRAFVPAIRKLYKED